MITKKKTIKSILCCTTACSALLLTSVAALNLNKPQYEIFATGVNSIPVSITNSNFNSSTQSSYPYSPNSYTAYNQGVKVNSSSSANVKAGVINLSNEKYETRFSLAKRTSLDDYVLMIDSTEEDSSTMHTVNYGYQTSSSVTLDANSKYMFTVDVFTATNAKIANLYLYDSNGEIFSAINGINSYNNWTTYTFFVATNNSESVSLSLRMCLEGAGTVLFDNISAFKLSDKEYSLSKNTAVEGTYTEENNIDNVLRTYTINGDGQLSYAENATSSSTFSPVDSELGKNSTLTLSTDSDGQNDRAILLKNTDSTYASYETEDLFTFEQNRVYKVSVKVKTKNLNGTSTLQLVRTDDEDDTSHNATISITSNTVTSSESVTNDYKTYSFLINSHPSQSTTYKLVFGLGTSSSLTTGEMYLSEIEISKINYSTFNISSNDSQKIDLVDAYKDSSIMLNNGDFNSIKIADYNSPMPATPTDWSVTTGTNTQKYGVVNTQTFASDLESLNLSNLRNPWSDAKNENVLMMYNETADTLSYKSVGKKLSANSYHKFDIDVQTQEGSLTAALVTTKDENEIVLCSKTINTEYNWETISLYIYTGNQSFDDVSLKLSLNTSAYGYAYVDNAKFDYTMTSSQLEEAYNNASNSKTTAKANISDLLSSSSTNKYEQAPFFTSEKVAGVETGTVTFNSSYLDEVVDGEENRKVFNYIAGEDLNKKALAIWAGTTAVNYSVTSNVGYTITANNYYKLSVDVFTQNLSGDNNTDASKIGAGIKLSGYDTSFKNIKSNNVWTTYTFYIKAATSETSYLELSLGTEDNKTKGAVFFTNIEFVASSEDEYKSVKNSSVVKLLKASETTTEDNTTEDTDTTTNNNGISNTTWIYLIPSLLTALAILIAIVGFAVRKIKWKKPTKKTKTTYDRNKTVSVQYYTRKAITLREEKVRELSADLEKINTERKQFEEDYKKDLTKLREMKIKRANPAEIAKLEKDLKKNQKMSSNLGVTANRISEELEYTKTDMYLNALIRKLSREQSTENQDTNEEK